MTEYKVELVKGMGCGLLVYADYSELPLSRTEVEYTLNAQEELIHQRDEKLKKVATLLEDYYPIFDDLTNEGFIDILERIMLIIFSRKIGLKGELE